VENDYTKLERELAGKNDFEIVDYFQESFRQEGKFIPRDDIFGMKHTKYTNIMKIMSMYSKNIVEPLVIKLLEANPERPYKVSEIAEILNLEDWDKHASLLLSAYSNKKDSNIICVLGKKHRTYRYSESCSEAKRQQHKGWKKKGFCFLEQCSTDECPKLHLSKQGPS
jgi:hypothetical protein